MDLKSLSTYSRVLLITCKLDKFSLPELCSSSKRHFDPYTFSSLRIRFSPSVNRFFPPRINYIDYVQGIVAKCLEVGNENGPDDSFVFPDEEEKEEQRDASGRFEFVEADKMEFEVEKTIWKQMAEIFNFSGPAMGLWLCAPLMSLIDTAVIGQGSSTELAALGPGTVFCDYSSYIFMFLSVATSNLVATALAKQDRKEVQRQISNLLFVGLICGCLMLFSTKFLGPWALTAFTGANNMHIIPDANKYIQIRSLAWPAILVGWVAQSASLGMKDSWGPLKALAVASAINGIGDIVLCTFLGYGIAGAAWATMVSQVVVSYLMIEALNKKEYNGFALSIPSPSELLQIFMLAAPLFVITISKVAFYTLLVFFATSMDTISVAAHQVMIQLYYLCDIWGEPLSQTAQAFMPELIYGVNKNITKSQKLLKSLVIIGAIFGLISGSIGTLVPWLFPNIFSADQEVIHKMHKVLIPCFLALFVTPIANCLEGTLLAGRDLKFISTSMSGTFILGAVLQLIFRNKGYGLPGCWFALVVFQWTRFFMALLRLASSESILKSKDPS